MSTYSPRGVCIRYCEMNIESLRMRMILFLKYASFYNVGMFLWDVVRINYFPFYLFRRWGGIGGSGVFVRVDYLLP